MYGPLRKKGLRECLNQTKGKGEWQLNGYVPKTNTLTGIAT